MTEREQLVIAQALFNVVGEQVSTKEPGNLRDRVSQEYVDLYQETGAKSFDVKLAGEKVGTFSLTVSKPTESKPAHDFYVDDKEAFKAWEEFKAAAMDYATEHLKEIAEWHFGNTGEVPPGCRLDTYEIAGNPGGQVSRTTLKIDTQAVIEKLHSLPEAVRYLLGGAND